MLARIVELPLFVLLIGASALAMMVPAFHGLATDDGASARGFGYAALLTFVLFAMIGLATWNHRVRQPIRANLVSILAFYAVLPVLLAWPMTAAMEGALSYGDAVFDMVSAITTTGAPILPLNATPSSVHLWRAEVAWFGGFFVWVTAIAVLAPLNLGGFEVSGMAGPGRGAESFTQITRLAGQDQRIRRYASALFPVYAILTGVLWLALIAAGDPPLVAITHAMSTLSTSGLSPLGGPGGAASGVPGEGLILLFFVFALSRLTFATEERDDGLATLLRDPELRLGLLIIGALPVLLSWSGLRTPGLVLMGLAIFGGGVATTAGGVKLLRVFALYKHGLREIEKLIQPSSIGGAGRAARRFRRQGAYLAWIAFMLFAFSIAVVWLALAFTGLDFETALVLTIASLTTCGPLIDAVMSQPVVLLDLPPGAKAIMVAAMVLGRLEALAVIALLNPDFWRG